MTPEQISVIPAPGRWPLWATVGHTACQRVSWLCGFLGEPGAEDTPFPNALYHCPGDEDLEHVLSPADLAVALDSTFRIIERVLDTWTVEMLAEEIRRKFPNEEWTHSRGWVLERVYAHDIAHIAELNESLGRADLPQIELWD